MPGRDLPKTKRLPDPAPTLLFDEAEALLRKRSDVKDSSDRYANIEPSAAPKPKPRP